MTICSKINCMCLNGQKVSPAAIYEKKWTTTHMHVCYVVGKVILCRIQVKNLNKCFKLILGTLNGQKVPPAALGLYKKKSIDTSQLLESIDIFFFLWWVITLVIHNSPEYLVRVEFPTPDQWHWPHGWVNLRTGLSPIKQASDVISLPKSCC